MGTWLKSPSRFQRKSKNELLLINKIYLIYNIYKSYIL
nr:MAG TPA: hypothetical protein [Caudoviricetes sp.]